MLLNISKFIKVQDIIDNWKILYFYGFQQCGIINNEI